MRRTRALLAVLALGAGACRLLVGVDDHVLRDDSLDASDEANDGGTDAATSDAPIEDARDAGAHYKVTVLASGRKRPANLLISTIGTATWYVFWTEESVGDGGAIMRVADDDALGTPELIATSPSPHGTRADGAKGIFFTDDARPVARLMHVGKVPGTTPVVYDSDGTGRGFGTLSLCSPFAFSEAVDPGASSAQLRRSVLDAAGGATCFTYTSPVPSTFPAAVCDGANVYFADTASGSILRALRTCDDTPTVFAANQQAVALNFDTNNVYWLTADGHVRRRDKAMGAVVTYDASLVTPGGLVDRNGVLYVADEGAGIIYEMAQDAEPVVIATGQGGPHSIVTSSAGTIYWANRATGEIVSAKR